VPLEQLDQWLGRTISVCVIPGGQHQPQFRR